MIDCKSAPTPFLSGVKLEDGRDTPLVDNTLYRQLVGACCISHTPDQTSPMHWAQSPGSCRSRMSYIGRLQSISFDTYRNHHLWDSLFSILYIGSHWVH
jgi:hypothetical protein